MRFRDIKPATLLLLGIALLVSCSATGSYSDMNAGCEWKGACSDAQCPVTGQCCDDPNCPDVKVADADAGGCEFCTCVNCPGTGKCANCANAKRNASSEAK